MTYQNGIHEEIREIKRDVLGIKDDLAISLNRVADALNILNTKFDQFIKVAENSIPIKAVFWMFLILILGLVGVEGADYLFKHYLPR